MTYTPTTVSVGDWGRHQIIVSDLDVTYFRDVETLVEEYSFTEPFSDALATLHFPQITSLEALPSWLTEGAEILIYRVPPSGSKTLEWRGKFVEEEDFVQEDSVGLKIQCLGILYGADLYIKTPGLNYGQRAHEGVRYGVKDLGEVISLELGRCFNLGLGPLQTYQSNDYITGVQVTDRGSYDQLLTSYIQGLLSAAQNYVLLDNINEIGIGIQTNPNGGYYVLSHEGNVIPFGGAPYYGGLKGISLVGNVIDMAVRYNGTGYYLLGKDGGVFAFNAPYYGNTSTFTSEATAIETHPSTDGYWVLLQDGGVITFGGVSFHGSAAGSITAGEVAVDLKVTSTGGGYWILDSHGAVFAYGDAVYHGGRTEGNFVSIVPTQTDDGYWLFRGNGDTYALGDATFYGNPTLTNEFLVGASLVSGTDGYYIATTSGSVFAFGGATFSGNGHDGGADAYQWSLGLNSSKTRPVLYLKDEVTEHWTIYNGAPGITHSLRRDFSMGFNVFYGEGVNKEQCRWRNTKYPDPNNYESSYVAPLASKTEVERLTFNPETGALTGLNPDWDPSVLRVEHYEHFGENISREQGRAISQSIMNKDGDPIYIGTIKLKSDPIEGPRFSIREGQNIVLKNHRGQDRKLHISGVRVNWSELSVEITVSERAVDYITCLAVIDRDRKGHQPGRRRTYRGQSSREVIDTAAVWDCESNAGVIPSTLLQAGWNVLQIPCGERGEVVETELTFDSPIQFAVGIFDRPVTKEWMDYWVGNNLETETGVWDSYFDPETHDGQEFGLIVAWGEQDQFAGYYPGVQSDGDPLTGRMKDSAQWYFESSEPPWLWLAIYCIGSAATISGRLRPGLED